MGLLDENDPDVWILPTLSYGRSVEHAGFVGTVTLSTDTLIAVCRDVGRSVAASGFHRLVFVNGHGGNVALLDVVARDIRVETGMMVFRIMASHFGLPELVECPDAQYAAHADYLETSVMLALDSSLVHIDLAEADGESAARLFGTQAARRRPVANGVVDERPVPKRCYRRSAHRQRGDRETNLRALATAAPRLL